MTDEISVFWFRRDLRLTDNHGLFKALESSEKVLPIFIFDVQILSILENKEDRRVDFILQALGTLNEYLEKSGKSIKILHGNVLNIFEDLIKNYNIKSVFCNEDYEPSAIKRDVEVAQLLKKNKVQFFSFKDQVHFHKEEILKLDKTPYTCLLYTSRCV